MPRYMRFGGGSNTVTRLPDDPSCFGREYDPNDSICNTDCEAYSRCGRASQRTTSSTPTRSTSRPSSSVSTYRSEGTTITRPKTPNEYPPGTEYLPPERAGESSAFERGLAIAKAEGLAAGLGQFFSSLAGYSKDITAWHGNAGRWKYGDKFDGKKYPKKTPSSDET